MVAPDCQDLTRIFHVRPVELVAIELLLVMAVNHVPEMQKERRVISGRAGVVVGGHRIRDVFLSRIGGAGAGESAPSWLESPRTSGAHGARDRRAAARAV